jgi:hypothetical protein
MFALVTAVHTFQRIHVILWSEQLPAMFAGFSFTNRQIVLLHFCTFFFNAPHMIDFPADFGTTLVVITNWHKRITAFNALNCRAQILDTPAPFPALVTLRTAKQFGLSA